MISDDERREVARRLRDDAKGGALPYSDFFGAVAYDVGVEKEHTAVLNRLADLIEPEPEHTCRMVSAFDTDELEDMQENISFSPEDTLAYRCEGCGFDFRYERGLYPSYCPNCGARVVGCDDA